MGVYQKLLAANTASVSKPPLEVEVVGAVVVGLVVVLGAVDPDMELVGAVPVDVVGDVVIVGDVEVEGAVVVDGAVDVVGVDVLDVVVVVVEVEVLGTVVNVPAVEIAVLP